MYEFQYATIPEDIFSAAEWLIGVSRRAFRRTAAGILIFPWIFAAPLALVARGPAIFLLASYYILISAAACLGPRKFVARWGASLEVRRARKPLGVTAWMGGQLVSISQSGVSVAAAGATLAIPWTNMICFDSNKCGLFLLTAIRGHDFVIIVPERAFSNSGQGEECLHFCASKMPSGVKGELIDLQTDHVVPPKLSGPGPWRTWRWQILLIRIWLWLAVMGLLAWPYLAAWFNAVMKGAVSFAGGGGR